MIGIKACHPFSEKLIHWPKVTQINTARSQTTVGSPDSSSIDLFIIQSYGRPAAREEQELKLLPQKQLISNFLWFNLEKWILRYN